MVSEINENGTIKDHGYLKSNDISRDDYFMDVARVIGEKCTCNRGKCGCVIVKDNTILASGFADAPEGSPKCDEVGHLMRKVTDEKGQESEHCMRNNCAEQNAIASAAKKGISLEGATLYVTMTPCTIRHCAHMVVACGISRVVCDKRYQESPSSEEILQHAGVEICYLNGEKAEY